MKYFIGIGAQKAGTSWLAHHLSSHPAIAVSPLKELHFFDQIYRADMCGEFTNGFKQRLEGLQARCDKGQLSASEQVILDHLQQRLSIADMPSKYRQYLDSLASSDQQAVMEITPSYSLLQAEGFRAIKSTLPGVKLIFIMRDPIARYWSQLRYHQKMQPQFDALGHCVKGLDDSQFFLRTDYRRTLASVDEVFSPGEVCHIFYEDLFSAETHQSTLRDIAAFMRVDAISGAYSQRVNTGLDINLPQDCLPVLRQRFEPIYIDIRRRFGDRVPESWCQ